MREISSEELSLVSGAANSDPNAQLIKNLGKNIAWGAALGSAAGIGGAFSGAVGGYQLGPCQ